MERITENVYAATDIRGCNPGYVLTKDGAVIIDTPQLPTKALAMREEILKKGRIRYLINTEHHIDHIFGNYFFAGLCPVVAHEQVFREFGTVSSGTPYSNSMEIVKKDDPEGIALMPTEENFHLNPHHPLQPSPDPAGWRADFGAIPYPWAYQGTDRCVCTQRKGALRR